VVVKTAGKDRHLSLPMPTKHVTCWLTIDVFMAMCARTIASCAGGILKTSELLIEAVEVKDTAERENLLVELERWLELMSRETSLALEAIRKARVRH
jgi:hypothetical protein